MSRLPLAVCALACAFSAFAQVSVREPATTARLVNNTTTISLAVTNAVSQPLNAIVLLELLGPDDRKHDFARITTAITPGDSFFDILLPLSDKFDPLLERMRYEIQPGATNYTAFRPVMGILSLTQLADYAFTLRILSAGLPHPARLYDIPVLTFHPRTGLPVGGVVVTSRDRTVISDKNGFAMLRVEVPDEGDSGPEELEIDAHLGDFHQSGETTPLPLAQEEVRIYTDKPLYQPGQTMHVRIIALSGAGPVRGEAEHEIRIEDEDEEVVHSETVTTSRFGVASTDWEIPANAKAGEYRIEVDRDDLEFPFRRTIPIRRYELPSFRVTARPEYPFYLLRQQPIVEISAEYLFGKPVTSGTARITDGDDSKPVAEGKLDGNGHFRATLGGSVELGDTEKYRDLHFTAFVTDASTNRTEQSKFDVRVSRDPLHIYLAKEEPAIDGVRLYISVYTPDGTPARTHVELARGGQVIAAGQTNRFGLIRIELPGRDYDDLTVRATAANGTNVKEPIDVSGSEQELWLDTDRILYRAGQSVRCRISARSKDAPVFLMAWNASGETVYARPLTLANGSADVSIPYDSRFGRELSIGIASNATRSTAARKVIFPGPDDLTVRAIPAKPVYRPGDTATIQFRASAEAALGIAVVDRSVFERAASDSSFKRRDWFDYGEEHDPSLGGLAERDLLSLDPAKIDDGFELAAAALVPAPALVNSADDAMEDLRTEFAGASAKALAPLKERLDQDYSRTLDYPRDESAFVALLGTTYTGLKDPWLKPWYVRFTTEGPDDVMRVMSAGPDKQRDTGDDYAALEIRRKWFANFEALIRGRMQAFVDLPATPDEFVRALDDGGIRFGSLRDPWGSPLRVIIAHHQDRRRIEIRSAGPERKTGARDDFLVAEFTGSYFAGASSKIGAAVSSAKEIPRGADDLRAVLLAAGVDFDSLRDPWGHPYYLSFHTRESFGDNIQVYSYSEYKGAAEQRKQLVPAKRTLLTIEIRSAGDDGIQGTYDDCEVASFTRVLEVNESEPDLSETLKPPSRTVGGTGMITGTVKDAAGGLIPNAQVTLNGEYGTRTDETGNYTFTGLRPGLYLLQFESLGFQRQVIDRIPAEADHVTRADAVMTIGATAMMVEVAAVSPRVAESSAVNSLVPGTAISTPHVREYFPETLYWQAELVTDHAGQASIKVKLADSITTWRVAAIASTSDGRITETTADVRAFQPFLVDLDVPPVLTAGDEIALPVPVRNYLDRPQNVLVSATLPRQISLGRPVEQPGQIQPSSSANATLLLRPEAPIQNARVRVSGIGQTASDAIEKPVSVHPDGERRDVTVNGVARDGRSLRVEVPAAAIAGSVRAEVKFYPSLLARMLESAEALLTRPYGCGEQTISSTYPNLMFLQALKNVHQTQERLEARATKNLLAGYQRLLRYQDEKGGFTYWGHGDPDIALTAYALSFLGDAKEFITVDDDRIKHAREWLAQQKGSEASTGALQIRTLARFSGERSPEVGSRLGDLARKADEFDDPYAVAVFVLAALDAGRSEVARPALEHLRDMAQDEQGAAFWALRANTPFHGWGRSGQVETTALAVSALARWRKLERGNPALDALVDRGVLFLLKNSGAGGSWSTSQSTVRVLDALLEVWAGMDQRKALSVSVRVNGANAGHVIVPDANVVGGPVSVDISRFVRPGIANEISFAGAGSAAIQTQVSAAWYETWDKPVRAKSLQFESQCGPESVSVNQAVTCEVLVSRPSFRGYGMIIAEIGLPPGAEVDRGTLSAVVDDVKNGVDSFEVAPDHVTFYVWPRADDSRFHFVFRPRFEMKARSAQSEAYDYYNPDERVVLSPKTFTVE